MKQTFLSGATLAALVMLVALPLVFILLQAIFPHFSAGSLGDAFGGIPALLADPQLPAMLGGTLWIAAGVALVSVMIGLPLGILRGMFSLPLPRLWDLLFLIPFLTPPYISALSWMLALQSQGYLQQLTGWQLNDLLFSRSGIVLVMTFNIFPVVYFAVSRSLLASGTRLAVVARVHGASAWRAFWHVTLPMLSPALAGEWQMSASEIGILYAAIPLGAACGALTSGNLAQSARPGLIMLLATLASFIAIGFFSLMPVWALGVMCLVIFGWLSAISSLLQYTLIQTQTPEGMLGRINGLWTAQNVTGDAIGAAILGGLGAIMTPAASASSSGFVLAMVGVILLVALVELRRFRQESVVTL